MSEPANDDAYSVQKFRGGFALVWRELNDDGEQKRRRRQLSAKDRQSAEAEARTIWEGGDNSPWTVGRIMTSYLATITTKARFAVVTVTIDAVTYVIVDIGLRMLKPRELARAQGFPDNYVLDPVVSKFLRGKWVERPLTIAEQISAIGNSVCPPVARALVTANQPGIVGMRLAA